jgi:hypothetical protein
MSRTSEAAIHSIDLLHDKDKNTCENNIWIIWTIEIMDNGSNVLVSMSEIILRERANMEPSGQRVARLINRLNQRAFSETKPPTDIVDISRVLFQPNSEDLFE